MSASMAQYTYIYFGVDYVFGMKITSNNNKFINVLLSGLLLVAVSAFAISPVVAQTDQPDWAADMLDRMVPMVDAYNENVNADDAGIAGDQLKKQKVNLIVTDEANGTTAEASFRLDGQLRMHDLRDSTRSDASMKMSTDRETMERIIEANDPSSAFQNAIAGDDITIDGLGPVNAVKWVVLNAISGLLR